MAPMPELISTTADWPKVSFHGPIRKARYEADQEVVEEFQRVADDGRGEDLDLVAGQTRASIKHLEHGVSPGACSFFGRASRLHPADEGKATPSMRRAEAHRDAGHLRIHARARA